MKPEEAAIKTEPVANKNEEMIIVNLRPSRALSRPAAREKSAAKAMVEVTMSSCSIVERLNSCVTFSEVKTSYDKKQIFYFRL